MANVTHTTSTVHMSITQLRARFSEACEMAEQGKNIIITKHGFPYMQLIPVTASDAALHQKPAKLEEAVATG